MSEIPGTEENQVVGRCDSVRLSCSWIVAERRVTLYFHGLMEQEILIWLDSNSLLQSVQFRPGTRGVILASSSLKVTTQKLHTVFTARAIVVIVISVADSLGLAKPQR